MNLKKISVLSLLLCLSLTACGDVNDLPELDSSSHHSSESSSDNSESTKPSSSVTPSTPEVDETQSAEKISNYAKILDSTFKKEKENNSIGYYSYHFDTLDSKINYVVDGVKKEDFIEYKEDRNEIKNVDLENNRYDSIIRNYDYFNSGNVTQETINNSNNVTFKKGDKTYNYMNRKYKQYEEVNEDNLYLVSEDHANNMFDFLGSNFNKFSYEFNSSFGGYDGEEFIEDFTYDKCKQRINNYYNLFLNNPKLEKEEFAIIEDGHYVLKVHQKAKDKFKCNFYLDEQLVEISKLDVTYLFAFDENELLSFKHKGEIIAEPSNHDKKENVSYLSNMKVNHEFNMSHSSKKEGQANINLDELVESKQQKNEITEKVESIRVSIPYSSDLYEGSISNINYSNFQPAKLGEKVPSSAFDGLLPTFNHVKFSIEDNKGDKINFNKLVGKSYTTYINIKPFVDSNYCLIIYRDFNGGIQMREVNIIDNPTIQLKDGYFNVNDKNVGYNANITLKDKKVYYISR